MVKKKDESEPTHEDIADEQSEETAAGEPDEEGDGIGSKLSFDDDLFDEDDEEDSADEDDEDDEEADEADDEDELDEPDYDEDYDEPDYDDEDYDDEDDEDEDDEAEAPDEEDPLWWTPHAVLVGLLLIGVLGAFGVFNSWLGFLAATPAGGSDAHAAPRADLRARPPGARPKLDVNKRPNRAPKGPIYGAKHLLVQYKGSRRAGPAISRTKEEAKKRAGEAAKKAAQLKQGTGNFDALSKKFSELAGKYSDEPGAAKRGGDLGRFRKGSMVPQFQAAVEKLKKGDVSGVVETPFGYHVILRTF